MLRVPIVHARAGMVLSMPIHHPACPEVVLLRAGAPLEETSLRRLREIGIHEMWIRYPALDELADVVHPGVQIACRQLVNIIGDTIDEVVLRSHARLDYPSYRKGVVGVLEQLSEHPKAAMFLGEMVGPQRPAMRHAANVCMLSLLMGLKLEFYLLKERSRLVGTAAKDITGLGVGAMLHDVGMLRLDDDTLARWNTTQNESDPAWQRHIVLGYEMVRGEVDATAASVVLHHHQKFDGSGFPRRRDLSGIDLRVAGSDIHVFARIVAAADLFDRLRNPPGQPSTSPSVPIVRVLNRLRGAPYAQWIDPVVFRALITVAPPYPPGTMVTLTGGQRAVVSKWFAETPCQPVVILIDDIASTPTRSSRATAPIQVDLRAEDGLQVIEVDGQDVAADNFAPTHKGEFDLLGYAKAIDNKASELGEFSTANRQSL